MSCLVVDASVGVKWYVPEIHSRFAARLLDHGRDLHVPDLFFPEFGNILWKKVVRGELSDAEARSILRALSAVPLESHPSPPLLDAALELAVDVSRTVYDSLYVALALALNGRLVTGDERLCNALEQTPFASSVIRVQDVPG